MKLRIALYFTIAVSLGSCRPGQNNDLTLRAIKAATTDKWNATEKMVNSMEGAVAKGGNRPADKWVLNFANRMAAWKKPALNPLSVAGLNQYIDSVANFEKAAKKAGVANYLIFSEKQTPAAFQKLAPELKTIPAGLKNIKDSVHFYSAFYMVLQQELAYHQALSGKINADEFSYFRVSKQSYSVGDTVKMLLALSRYEVSKTQFSTNRLKTYFNGKPAALKLSKEYIGGVLILKFPVPEKGVYKIEGPVMEVYPESGKTEIAQTIRKEFKVE